MPEVPAKYHGSLGRTLREPSGNPASLLSHPSWPTWAALGAAALAPVLAVLLVALAVKTARRLARRRAAP